MKEIYEQYFYGIIQEIYQIVGYEATHEFCLKKGGRVIYFPSEEFLLKEKNKNHWMIKIFGLENALKVARLLGSGEIHVPVGSAAHSARIRVKVLELRRQGKSIKKIVETLNASEKNIRRIINTITDFLERK